MHGLASDGGNAADSSGNEKAEEHWSGSPSSSPGSAPTVGIALRDGVSELDATAAFEVYTQSAAARTVAFATEDKIRTRHGLVLLTTSTREAPSLSRIVAPGAADIDPRPQHWADGRHLDVEALGRRSGTW